jgi:hypothetical protein
MTNILSVPESFLKSKGIKHPRYVIYAAGAVVAGVVVYIIIRKIVGPKKYFTTQISSALSDVMVNSSNLTISNGDAIIISQNLLQAMNRFGTDEQAIFDSLDRLQTQDDLLLVIKTFGIKLYDGFGLAVDWVSRNFLSTPKNLQGWLRAELSGSDLKRVKAKFDELGVEL